MHQVQVLRAEGRSPKQIARILGVQPAVIAPIIRAIAVEEAEDAPEPPIAGCWVSAGWSAGLTVASGTGWPDREGCGSEGSGLVGVVVAREHRRPHTVSVCGWLVDAYCLGVKDAIGPLVMDRYELRELVRRFFDAFDGEAIEAPVELAKALVWGSIDYARGLGFEPAPDFAPTAGHLAPPTAPSGISFGHHGAPLYGEGPYDDAAAIMRTLQRTAGTDNFEFVVTAAV